MKFKETKLAEAVSLLDTKGGTGKEKRRAPRRDIHATISIVTTQDSKAELCDLSARGVRLIVAEPIPEGTQFTLHLPSKPGTQRSPIICQVVRCRKDSEGRYVVGAEFIGSVRDDGRNSAESDRIRASILN